MFRVAVDKKKFIYIYYILAQRMPQSRKLPFVGSLLHRRLSSCDASGTHKQKNKGKAKAIRAHAELKRVDHAFVTPRVKSAAKSREAVSLLNQIVVKKDRLLKKAIENMDRKEKTLLTSQNNDFLKFVSSYPPSVLQPRR